MVFGSNTSSTCWEPFRRVIEGLTVKIANRPDLVGKTNKQKDMVKWELRTNEHVKPVKEKKCKLNHGVLHSFGKQIARPSRIWVNDTLIAAVGVATTKMVPAAVMEAMFVVVWVNLIQYRDSDLWLP